MIEAVKMKKIICLVVSIILLTAAFAGCGADSNGAGGNTSAERTVFRIGVLNGSTGMGMSYIMKNASSEKYKNTYNIELFSAPTDVTGLLINGELDIAALPTNLASTLFNKTNGQIHLLAINTLGVLYVLEKGDTVHSVKDLEGKKIYSSGQSATPQYALDYVLKKNNINCNVEYFATHAELAAQALAGNADIILMPEPQVSNILMKNTGFRIALDFNDVWNEASDNKALLSMGCLVVRADFAQKNKDAIALFLDDYAESVKYVNENVSDSAKIIKEFNIVPSEEIAQKAIPNSSIVLLTGDEMKTKTNAFLAILYESDPSVIGGKMPDESFYI